MRSWTIRYTDDSTGEPTSLDPTTETEARHLLPAVQSWFDSEAELVDLYAELRDRLPVNATVTHTGTRRLRGTVTEVDGASAPFDHTIEPGTRVAHVIDHRGYGAVHVVFNDRPCWYMAECIEVVDDAPAEPVTSGGA
jgi:hypothetical protein